MLKLFDSLAKKKRVFRPLKKGLVTMYNCGPTVYDYVHIGNLRSFLLADLLRRYLEHRGFEVRQVMNITDVGHMLADADVGEDKMETAAAKAGQTPQEVAKFYTDAFMRDIDRLGVRHAAMYPRASDHVEDMIAMIGKLLERGHAYMVTESDGGTSVYFDVSTFPTYGQLSGNTIADLAAGARVDVRTEKKHPADFALWIHNPKHLMQWEAPWGTGYPGWHIECSAMSTKYLGETIDIHTGGEDNKFPHHECEIAQAEGATGKKFVRFWVHVTHLMVEGQKMSKSKGNFFCLDDLTAKGHDEREVRWLLMSTHYRQALNFTMHGLDSARTVLKKLDAFADSVERSQPTVHGRSSAAAKALKAFDKALDDDLNIAEATAALFEYLHLANELMMNGKFTVKEKTDAAALLGKVGDVLGFVFGSAKDDVSVPPSIQSLVEKREAARKEKRFVESDRLRDEIAALGWLVEDSSEGSRVKRL